MFSINNIISKIRRGKLKESPEEGPPTRVEPANGSSSTADRWH